jgi:hypothetical protein
LEGCEVVDLFRIATINVVQKESRRSTPQNMYHINVYTQDVRNITLFYFKFYPYQVAVAGVCAHTRCTFLYFYFSSFQFQVFKISFSSLFFLITSHLDASIGLQFAVKRNIKHSSFWSSSSLTKINISLVPACCTGANHKRMNPLPLPDMFNLGSLTFTMSGSEVRKRKFRARSHLFTGKEDEEEEEEQNKQNKQNNNKKTIVLKKTSRKLHTPPHKHLHHDQTKARTVSNFFMGRFPDGDIDVVGTADDRCGGTGGDQPPRHQFSGVQIHQMHLHLLRPHCQWAMDHFYFVVGGRHQLKGFRR